MIFDQIIQERHKKSNISKPYLESKQGGNIPPSTWEPKLTEVANEKGADLLTGNYQQPSTHIQEEVLKTPLNTNS